MTTAEPHEIAMSNGNGWTSVPEGVFSQPPAAFIESWAAAFGLDDLSQADRDSLVGALRGGTSRLRVIDALERRRSGHQPSLRVASSNGVRRPPDCFAVIELFTRFAPDDDAAFLRHAFGRICDRGPGDSERLELEFDLRRGAIDRADAVKRIVDIAAGEGRGALWDSLEPRHEGHGAAQAEAHGTHLKALPNPASARTMPTGLVYDEHGRETLIFVRDVPGTGLVVAPDVLRQSPKSDVRGWLVQEGWLIVGPKRSFKPGRWRVDVDLLQPADAILDLDVVANSGLDLLQHLAVCGSFLGSFCVDFRPEHRFSELRLAVRGTQGESPWLRPRNISMQRVG